MRDGAIEDREQLRKVAASAVNLVEPGCRSRMAAYEKVAAAVGFSASYLRKFITVEFTPEPRWSAGVALIRYYEILCDRVEADIAEQRSEIAGLVGELNAPDPSAGHIQRSISLPPFLGPPGRA